MVGVQIRDHDAENRFEVESEESDMGKDRDIVTTVLYGIGQTVMAPFEAAVEFTTDGSVSDRTADNVIRGLVGDIVSDSLSSDD